MANNTYIVNSARFQPFTYDELVKPLDRLETLHTAMEDSYDKFNTVAQTLDNSIGDDNPIARSMYDSYMKTFEDAYDSLAREGINPNNWNKFSSVKKSYNSNLTPIANAVAKRQEDVEKMAEFKQKHPNVLFSDLSNIDDYLSGNQKSIAMVDLDAVSDKAKDAAKAMSERYYSDPVLRNRMNGYLNFYSAQGLNSTQAFMAASMQPKRDEDGNILKDENGNIMYMFPEFAIEAQRLMSEGDIPYLSENKQQYVLNAIQEGFNRGIMYKPDSDIKDDWYAKESVQLANAKELKRYEKSFDNPIGSYQFYSPQNLYSPDQRGKSGEQKRTDIEKIFSKDGSLNIPGHHGFKYADENGKIFSWKEFLNNNKKAEITKIAQTGTAVPYRKKLSEDELKDVYKKYVRQAFYDTDLADPNTNLSQYTINDLYNGVEVWKRNDGALYAQTNQLMFDDPNEVFTTLLSRAYNDKKGYSDIVEVERLTKESDGTIGVVVKKGAKVKQKDFLNDDGKLNGNVSLYSLDDINKEGSPKHTGLIAEYNGKTYYIRPNLVGDRYVNAYSRMMAAESDARNKYNEAYNYIVTNYPEAQISEDLNIVTGVPSEIAIHFQNLKANLDNIVDNRAYGQIQAFQRVDTNPIKLK